MPVEFKINDIVGKRFGKLVVQKFKRSVKEKYPFKYFYSCKCDCGKIKEVQRCNLINNEHTRSCGCLKLETGKNNKTWTGFEGISGGWWTSIKRKAEYRNLKFNVTMKYAWDIFNKQKGLCALSGIPINMLDTGYKYKRQKQHLDRSEILIRTNKNPKCFKRIYRTASLDRIDSLKGYVKNNLQWVHKDINRMKLSLPQERFIELCNLVSSKNKK